MKNRTLQIILLLALIVIVGLSFKSVKLSKYTKISSDQILELTRQNIECQDRVGNLIYWRGIEKELTTKSVPTDLWKADSNFNNGDHLALPELVYYFDSETACNSCISAIMEKIIGCKSLCGEDRILIISNFQTSRDFDMFKLKYNLLESCKTFPGFLDSIGYQDMNIDQMLFIIDNGRVCLPYVLSSDEPISEDYFDLIEILMSKGLP